jgi:hypothetical protein
MRRRLEQQELDCKARYLPLTGQPCWLVTKKEERVAITFNAMSNEGIFFNNISTPEKLEYANWGDVSNITSPTPVEAFGWGRLYGVEHRRETRNEH